MTLPYIPKEVLQVVFPILAVLPVLINGVAMRRDPRHGDAFGLSVMVLAIWIAQTAVGVVFAAPDRSGFNAGFDTIAALAVLGCWVTNRSPWLLGLLSLYLAQVYLASAFWWGWELFNHGMKYGDYVGWNNVIWLLELVVLSVAGGWGVVRRLLDDLRHRADPHHSLGSAT